MRSAITESYFKTDVMKLIEKLNDLSRGHIAKFEVTKSGSKIIFGLPRTLTAGWPKVNNTGNPIGSSKSTVQIQAEKVARQATNPWDAVNPGPEPVISTPEPTQGDFAASSPLSEMPDLHRDPFVQTIVDAVNNPQDFSSTEEQTQSVNPIDRQTNQLELKPSSNVQGAVYYPDKEYLIVSFKSGSTYAYSGVSIWVIVDWESAASTGSYFYHNIRTSYNFSKVG